MHLNRYVAGQAHEMWRHRDRRSLVDSLDFSQVTPKYVFRDYFNALRITYFFHASFFFFSISISSDENNIQARRETLNGL